MANPRPTRTKKSTAAITNPDNVANLALSSHKTVADAARMEAAKLAASRLSQAVRKSSEPVGSDSDKSDSYRDPYQATPKQAVPPPSPTTSVDGEASTRSSEDEEVPGIEGM